MIEFLPVVLALISVCVANYTDLKERIIPNELTFTLIAVGVVFYLFYGLFGSFGPSEPDFYTFIAGAVGAALAFAIGYGLWLIGAWAGGDVKMFTALGALLPGIGKFSFKPSHTAPYPLPITIMFNSIIAIAPILFAYIAISCARKPDIGRKIMAPFRGSARRYLEAPLVLVGCSALGLEIATRLGFVWPLRPLLVAVLLFAVYLIPFKVRLPISALLTLFGLYLNPLTVVEAFVIILLLLPGLRLLVSAVNVANREVLQEKVRITELKEGMIPAETIYESKGKVGRYKAPGYGKLFELASRDPSKLMRPKWERVLADPRVAAGVTRGQARALKQLVKRGKLKDNIRIKKGMPFAPAFGLGVFISVFFGDIYWFFILAISGISLGFTWVIGL
jgi:preflagellin peptidase FlaK